MTRTIARSTLPAAALFAAAVLAPSAQAAHHRPPVRTHNDSTLGQILVNSKGRTLYHLKGESRHKFICTDKACLSLWHPLTVHSRKSLHGEHVHHLGVVRRPDSHKLQVDYKGKPLYTFTGDHHKGDTNGQGFENVWFVLVLKPPASSMPPSSDSSSSSSPPPSSSSSPPPYTYPGY